MSGKGCIVYLLPSDMLWLDGKLEAAQQHALEKKVPLAVVVCLPPKVYSRNRLSLVTLEATLAAYNIPLVVLLGSESEVLPGFVKSVRPLYVYGHGGGLTGSVKLETHPYKWQAIVIPTTELARLIDKSTRI